VSSSRKRDELGRGERVLPGVWRLRLPLPWPGVPHVNAFAVAAGDGIVLFDTGYYFPEVGTRQLEFSLAQAGFELDDVRLLVCTHAHTDHYGLAGPILDAAGCELWMHPAWDHVRALADDPDGALDRRIEVARQSGVPAAALRDYETSRRGEPTGIARAIAPDRELVPGVQVETDLGLWQVHETPGHAPSHVVLHQPESGLLISGDHLLGRISLFFDYGHTPDPVSEFLTGLDTVEKLDVGLCLAGHGRPFRDARAKVAANRTELDEQIGRVRDAFGPEPRTVFEVAAELVGPENLTPATTPWALQLSFAYIDHLTARSELVEVDGEDPRRWRPHTRVVPRVPKAKPEGERS
jgi:glyoxylase-like metal-dependent hydrolase (beta-lactamase superfamily II)